MIEAALQWLKDNVNPNVVEVDGKKFSKDNFRIIEDLPDLASALEVATLSGLADLVKAKFESIDDTFLAHVVSPTQVDVIGSKSDEHGRRLRFVTAKANPRTGMQLGVFHDHNDFVIGLQQHFVPNDDTKYLLTLAANLTDEKVVTSTDDGITQTVGTRAGVTWKATTEVKSRVKLAPYRTFTEVAQPESTFILRMRSPKDPGVPKLALFDADGGAWRKEAMDNIARFLSTAIDITVIS